jgi:hypothetical protein
MEMDEKPPGGVVVTPKEVYDAVQGLGRKIDQMMLEVGGLKETAADHARRLRAGERILYAVVVAVVLLGGGEPLLSLLGNPA